MKLQGTTQLFIQYLEYVALLQRSGLSAPYCYATWVRSRSEF